MLQAHKIISTSKEPPSANIVATYEERQKSRHRTKTQCGQDIGWFIERGYVLQEGDLLQCDDGTVVALKCADESVSTIQSDDPLLLLRSAYHLGNRHVPLQVNLTFLRYQRDHVLDAMVEGFGLEVNHEEAPFHPESGAYSQHGASHTHTHAHTHGQHTHEH